MKDRAGRSCRRDHGDLPLGEFFTYIVIEKGLASPSPWSSFLRKRGVRPEGPT